MHGITIAAELAYLAADERLEDGNAFLLLEDSDNKDIAKSCRKSANQFTLGAMKQKGLLALKCWIQEHTQSEVHVDSLLCVDFNQQTKRVYVKKVHHLSNKKAVKVSIPGVFKDEEWVSFETGMIEYFKAHTVSNGIQMHYMLCDDKLHLLLTSFTLYPWRNKRIGLLQE